MLEDRLDPRLTDLEPPANLAQRWKQTKREREAAAFDDVADMIEAGLLQVRGVKREAVLVRLRTRADNTRAGTDRHRRSALPRN